MLDYHKSYVGVQTPIKPLLSVPSHRLLRKPMKLNHTKKLKTTNKFHLPSISSPNSIRRNITCFIPVRYWYRYSIFPQRGQTIYIYELLLHAPIHHTSLPVDCMEMIAAAVTAQQRYCTAGTCHTLPKHLRYQLPGRVPYHVPRYIIIWVYRYYCKVKVLIFYKKLKNVSCEYDRLNGWNSNLQATYIRHVRWTCLFYIYTNRILLLL